MVRNALRPNTFFSSYKPNQEVSIKKTKSRSKLTLWVCFIMYPFIVFYCMSNAYCAFFLFIFFILNKDIQKHYIKKVCEVFLLIFLIKNTISFIFSRALRLGCISYSFYDFYVLSCLMCILNIQINKFFLRDFLMTFYICLNFYKLWQLSHLEENNYEYFFLLSVKLVLRVILFH